MQAPQGDPPLVSVLVLTHNHASYISSCLRSLSIVSYPRIEVHLLDDGSTDGTFAKVQSLITNFPHRVLARTQQRSGRTAENSQALLSAARGKYTLFMSGDDVLVPDFPLGTIVDTMERDERIAMSFSRTVHATMGDCSDNQSIYSASFRELLRSGDPDLIFDEHLCRAVSRLFLQGCVVRTAFTEEFNGFDSSLLADDYAFMMRAFCSMRRSGKRIAFFEDSLWIYRVHSTNLHKHSARQRELVFEVVAKYVPPACWVGFKWDHPEPDNVDELNLLCDQLIKHFGQTGRARMVPDAIRRFAYNALRRRDNAGVRELLGSKRTRRVALPFILPRLYRLIG